MVSFKHGFHLQHITDNDTGTDDLWKPRGKWREDRLGNWKRSIIGIIRDSYDDWEDYWDMSKKGWGAYHIWECGYINERISNIGESWNPPSYWWCRYGDWFPLWGPLTIRHAKLIKEIKHYWKKKKAEVQYKKAIILYQWNKDLPEDLISSIISY